MLFSTREKFINGCLLLVSTVACLLVVDLAASFWVEARQQEHEALELTMQRYRSGEAQAFVNAHRGTVHHVRGHLHLAGEEPIDLERLLFTTIAGFGPETRANVLIHGDSWAEQASFGPSRAYLEQVAAKDGLGIVAAGVSSYAPSPMTLQLRLLREEFDLWPTVVFGIVDQTDIGDELNRYTDRVFDDAGRLIALDSRIAGAETFDYGGWGLRTTNVFSDAPALVKLIRHLGFQLDDYRLGRGRHDMPSYGWDDIKAPLDGAVTPAELDIFDQSLDRYIAEVFVDPNVDRLCLVTHPHRNHLLPEDDPAHYPVDVRERVAAAVARSPWREQIVHTDFTADFAAVYGDRPAHELFQVDDPASHLTDAAHAAFYLPRLMRALD
jgi:hypothetical protein